MLREILSYREAIDSKYDYLFDGPQEDPEGNPSVIRYSRKTKEQYVQTEVDGKPSGWKAFYESGSWKVTAAKPVKKKAKKKAKKKVSKKTSGE